MSLNPRILSWKDRRVWIVGASSGIGHALTLALLEKGARVAVSARTSAPLQMLHETHPEQVLTLPLDVRSGTDWAEAHARILSTWKALDHFIYCAADYRAVRAWDLDIGLAEKMIDTNLTGALRGTATVLPPMLAAGRGGIALIASVAGYTGLPKALVYGPTKAALINFAESLYADVHGHGIAVSLINPGFVETPLTRGNDFRMPALISAAEAATEIINGLEAGAFEIHFPKRFTRWLKFLRLLPYPLALNLVSRMAGS